MKSLDTPITVLAIRGVAGRAWSWWVGELKDAIPASIRKRILAERPEISFYLGADEGVITRWDNNEPKEIVRFALQHNLTTTAILPDIDGLRHGRPRLGVLLSPSFVLRREIELPLSAEPRLRQVVALDLDRQTPFTSEGAAFDCVVRSRDEATSRIQISLALAKRETIEAVLALCARLGLRPDAIRVGRLGETPSIFDLKQPNQNETKFRALQHPRWLLAASLGLLVAFNLTLAFWRLDAQAERLTAELGKARAAAKVTEKLRTQLARSQSEARLFSESRSQAGPLDILRALTRTFPDDVWLFDLELNNGAVQIGGYAPSAAELINLLDQTREFTNPRFKAPVTRTDRANEDRFEITVDLRPEAAK